MKAKKDVNWTPKAPQRICSQCASLNRYGTYSEKFYCTKHDWTTKGNAVCDDFVQAGLNVGNQ